MVRFALTRQPYTPGRSLSTTNKRRKNLFSLKLSVCVCVCTKEGQHYQHKRLFKKKRKQKMTINVPQSTGLSLLTPSEVNGIINGCDSSIFFYRRRRVTFVVAKAFVFVGLLSLSVVEATHNCVSELGLVKTPVTQSIK